MSLKYFDSIEEAKRFQQQLMKQQQQITTQIVKEDGVPLTKKEVKAQKDQKEVDIKQFFIQLKEDFISKDKKAPTRAKLIKKLSTFIEDTYKNSDLLF